MEIIDYSKLKELRLVEVDQRACKKKRVLSLFILIVLSLFLAIPDVYGIYVGMTLSLSIFISKFIINKLLKDPFLFLSKIDDNYIEIVYKNKLQSINSKVTCHPECNPVRIVQTESNRLYTLSNVSGSILNFS